MKRMGSWGSEMKKEKVKCRDDEMRGQVRGERREKAMHVR